MTKVYTSLERKVLSGPTPPEDVAALAGAVWRRTGKALLDPAEIADEWERQVVVNVANRLYGKRDIGK